MGLGGAESFMMNLYRKLIVQTINLILIYEDYADVQDYHSEIERLGGRILLYLILRKYFKYLIEVNKLLKESFL